jgi:hypothetical protein
LSGLDDGSVDVAVFDFDADAAFAQPCGCLFGHCDAAFPDYGAVSGVEEDRGMLVLRTGTGLLVRRPSKPRVSVAVANMQPGGSVILDRVEEKPGDSRLSWFSQA